MAPPAGGPLLTAQPFHSLDQGMPTKYQGHFKDIHLQVGGTIIVNARQISRGQLDVLTELIAECETQTDHIQIFPFEGQRGATLTHALERLGRENEYLDLGRPVAEAVARYSDRIVATSDNPRTEDPTQILVDVEAGLATLRRVDPDALDELRARVPALQRRIDGTFLPD